MKDGLIIKDNGNREYWVEGKLHRGNNLPAVECKNGNKYWYVDGKRHRENGPAMDCYHGYRAWYIDGVKHRLDGPAVIDGKGGEQYWYKGDQYSESDFLDIPFSGVELQTPLPNILYFHYL